MHLHTKHNFVQGWSVKLLSTLINNMLFDIALNKLLILILALQQVDLIYYYYYFYYYI